MKKTISLIFLLLHVCFYAISSEISKDDAINIALSYIESDVSTLKHFAMSRNITTQKISINGLSDFYVVSFDDGWILVSGDDISIPVLAVVPHGKFSYNSMPENMRWLISYYEKTIRYSRDSIKLISKDTMWTILSDTKTTNRSITTTLLNRATLVHWDQNNNNSGGYCTNAYNKFCPDWYTPSCGRTYAGCTAVAMAQVLWYWQWPYSAVIPNSIDSFRNVSSEKHIVEYDWDKMPTDVYITTPTYLADNAAGLLRDCGYACKMKYGIADSGASLDSAGMALTNIFHYSSSINKKRKSSYPLTWTTKLRNEINGGRPIIYAGYDEFGGHAFVLCGYDSDNKFYINWGYSGNYNGWFALNAMQPNPLKPDSYNDDQEALFGVEPNFPNCTQYVPTSSELNQNIFQIYDESIFINNKTIQSSKTGVLFAQNEIRLTGNVHIQSGSNVHLAIRNMHCSRASDIDSNAEEYLSQPQYNKKISEQGQNMQKIDISPNPANDIITITSQEQLENIRIYSITGQCVLQTKQTDINVSELSSGIYIVTANTTDGNTLQSKFVKM